MNMKKLLTIIAALFVFFASGAQNINLHRQDASVRELMQEIQQKYGYSFSLSSDVVDIDRKVPSVNIESGKIDDALKVIFKGQDVSYSINGKTIVVTKVNLEQKGNKGGAAKTIKPSGNTPANSSATYRKPAQDATSAKAQTQGPRVIKGKVVDETGEAMIGAGVMSADGKRGVVTDLDGNYSFPVIPGDRKLVFSFIGYTSRELEIGDDSVIDVILLPDKENRLNDAVVIGYGTVKKKDLTGSVANVKMSDIQAAPVVSIDQALQGRVAGVDIMNTTGEPGAATSIRVRGTRSVTASNEPLIILDGVMDAVSDFGDINPDDIESVTILKDASSTAIYGSRGANGVIMVTTKTGSSTSSKPVIRAKAVTGVSWISKHLDLMNTEEFTRYRNDFWYANGATETHQIPRYDPDNYTNDTDWISAITRVAPYQNYNVSASGRDKGYNYFTSLSFWDERGIVLDSGQQRISGRLNFNKDLAKWFTLGLKASTVYRVKDRNKAVFSGSGYSNGAMYLPPVIGLLDNQNPFIDNSALINTPYASIMYEDYYDKSWTNMDVVEFRIKPVKGLVINSQNSIGNTEYHIYHFWPNELPKRIEAEGADAYKFEREIVNLSSENTVTYNTKFGKHHFFEAMAGYSLNRQEWSSTSATAKGIISDAFSWNNLNAVSSKDGYNIGSSYQRILRQSVYGRFNYNYRGKYYVTATLRADGSSNFAENRKWGFFPSIALKWNMKKEFFFKKARWINDLNLRASAGSTGNDAIAAYLSQQAYTSTTASYIFDGNQGASFYPSRLASTDLTWEKTDQYNIALEGAVFKERLTFDLEAYYSRTTDLLLQVSTVASTGYTSRYTNLGLTTNKGVELTLESKNFERKNFGWTTSFTVSHNSQMVNDIGHESYVSCVDSPDSYMMYGYKAGYPLNALWGFKAAGCVHNEDEYNENIASKEYAYRNSFSSAKAALGHPRYIDKDHDGMLTQADLFYLGNADPDLYGGLQNTFHFGNLQLSIYFAYSLGGKIYNYSELYMGGGSYTNQYRYALDSWHPVRNPDSDQPIAGSSRWLIPSDKMVYDASYLRLKDVSLQYTFNMPASFKVFRELTVGLSGTNLKLWSDYLGFDPDVSTESEGSTLRRVDKNSYPTSKRIVANVSIKF